MLDRAKLFPTVPMFRLPGSHNFWIEHSAKADLGHRSVQQPSRCPIRTFVFPAPREQFMYLTGRRSSPTLILKMSHHRCPSSIFRISSASTNNVFGYFTEAAAKSLLDERRNDTKSRPSKFAGFSLPVILRAITRHSAIPVSDEKGHFFSVAEAMLRTWSLPYSPWRSYQLPGILGPRRKTGH